MSLKPVVLIIENSRDLTGGLNSIFRSCQELSGDFEFRFVLPSGSPSRKILEEKGFAVDELPMRELSRRIMDILAYLPLLLYNLIGLKSVLRRNDPALIISNDFYNLIMPFYRMFGGQRKYICFVRFRPSKFPNWLAKNWFRLHATFAEQIIAVSEAVKAELPKHEKVIVMYNGMLGGIHPYNANPSSRIILYLGNYIPGKGQQHALQCFGKLKAEFPGWRIRFVGGDLGLNKNKRYLESLKSQCSSLGCDGNADWSGPAEHIEKEFSNAAFAINFSDSESFSLTTLEALFYGRPVVVTDCGGPREIVTDQKDGILVPVGDIAAMTDGMRFMMADDERRTVMGNHGYNSARQRFGPEQTHLRLRQLLNDVLRQQPLRMMAKN